ncbi:TonB-dependent receptor [Kordiimonas sp. SCSIO 12603]|uniref:TonB-dependent receptor plug domain-containing protein n=1 Tax=Kordiimonas sp. SCSIO 12603 TaxID=2829596 RepID=UPI002104E4C9|nr:TonB-dependent receptor [Kordiimonas sp. SCSIO 12603]UTW58787.1 TonB-dependent receptor [Kordiimonas sp. SCSIO 12603]
MFGLNKKTKNAFLCSVAVIASLSTGAAAQEIDDDTLEEVVVTGTRIKRSGATAPSPVTVIGAESIALQGEVNIANFLNQLPALGSTRSAAASTGFIGTTGTSFLDLRRLGTARTLVLQNGRRHVGTQAGSAAVDINSIPQELVERVEVLTGGASAVYGADAVTGVVNFITKKDFEGVSIYGQAGQADEGDAFSYTTRIVAGDNFGDGRGNAVLSVEWSETDGFLATDRSESRRNLSFRPNPANGDTPTNTNDGIPDEILFEGVSLNFINGPGIFRNRTTGEDFTITPTGFRPFDIGESIGGGRSINGTGEGVPLDVIGGSLQGDSQRAIVTASINYSFREELNLFIESKYVNSQAFSEGTGSFDTFGRGLNISADNGFLNDEQRQFFVDQGIDSLGVSRIDNLFPRTSDTERTLFRGVIGFEGQFENGISYDTSFVYGRSNVTVAQGNNRINDRFTAGVDSVIDPATGNVVCRSDIDPEAAAALPDFAVNGCVPINILGEGNISQEAADYFLFTDTLVENLEQKVVALNVAGDSTVFGFELPAGPISWAIGGEYREEDADSTPTGIDRLGVTFLNVIPVTRGGFDVKEAYAEVSVPLLSGVTFAQDLSIDAALRLSDYSTVGNTTTYNVGLNWQPIDDLRFRGTYSRSVRAPNISELFGPQSQTFFGFDDPCDVDFVDQGNENRAANCRALGIDPTTFQEDETRGTQPGLQGGNPNLGEESADTYTIGGVFTPSFVPGLTLTVDYWNIDITDAIDTASFQNILDNCVDAPNINNAFCAAITRDASGQVVEAVRINNNIAGLKASGIDFEVNYQFPVESLGLGDYGDIQIRTLGTYLINRDDFPFQTAPDEIDEEAGELGDPEWSVNTSVNWNIGRFNLNYEIRFIDSQLLVEQDDLEADPDLQFPFSTGSAWYHDVRVGYKLTDNVDLFGGVNNLTQKVPPVGLSGAGTGSAIFDNIGRFYYFGVRATF